MSIRNFSVEAGGVALLVLALLAVIALVFVFLYVVATGKSGTEKVELNKVRGNG